MSIKKQLPLFLFRNEIRILNTLRLLSVVSSVMVVVMMIYRYGFNHNTENLDMIVFISRFFYLAFIFNYLIKLILSKDKIHYLTVNAFEGILILLVLYDGLSYFLLGHPVLEKLLISLNIENYRGFYHFIIQFFLLFFVGIEFIKSVNSVYTSKLKPTTLFTFSFIILILIGGALLTLPGFNTTGQYLNFIDSLFTSASASCVTGLTVVNTSTFFNTKGQLIILFLIQLGGIGILTFASFFASFVKKGIGVKHQIAMNEILDSENISGTYYLLKRILIMTFVIEGLGALGIYMLWGNFQFPSLGAKIYASVFHSISSFCNAGFSNLEYGFETPLANELYMLHIFMGVIIFLGGLGFPALKDVFSPVQLRDRLKHPWKSWKLSTKIAIYTSFFLILLGMAAFYFLYTKERYADKGIIAQIGLTFFQSVNLRTSGFNSINLESLPNVLMLICIFQMFIGASSASTGGGIKTSTFVVMMVAVIGTIRGKKEMTLDKRTIAIDLIYKAFAVVIFSGLFVLLIITLMTVTEPGIPPIKLAYESVSAFATVGLSTGITAQLTDASKIILIISMFIGRVGILTLAYSLSTKAIAGDFKYATTHMQIG